MVRTVAASWRWRARSSPLFLALAWAAGGPAYAQDADGDGVLDPLEDVNGNTYLGDDDTDLDLTPDWMDDDDDDDGIPTLDEDWDGDGDWFDEDQGGSELVPDFRDAFSPVDDDGDGYLDPEWGGDDCDDLRSTWNPGAVDVWYDGRNVDCSPGTDFDQDRDGYDVPSELGGDDCDDLNPAAHPGAVEDPGGDDLDCDDYADPANPLVANGGCDCATPGPGGSAVLSVLALLALVRRRGR